MVPRRLGLGLAAILYGAVALTANPSRAAGIDAAGRTALEQMRGATMQRLIFHDEPRPRIAEGFEDGEGKALTLADFAGKVVVMNFWATWCPPCRAEMPSLDRLAAAVKGDGIEVLAVSTDRGGAPKVRSFFGDIGVAHLGVYSDASSRMARAAMVLGLPVTLILDRQGREIARLTGDAQWDSPESLAILRQIASFTRQAQTQGAFRAAPGRDTTLAQAAAADRPGRIAAPQPAATPRP
ncbi:MAG: TlpA disulfide reductase family protein [Thermohalobaculum sp.]|nr:TlpA disulfide reductase family protein [Thermohalobaculum sp.]